jgi:hypothetical protein
MLRKELGKPGFQQIGYQAVPAPKAYGRLVRSIDSLQSLDQQLDFVDLLLSVFRHRAPGLCQHDTSCSSFQQGEAAIDFELGDLAADR